MFVKDWEVEALGSCIRENVRTMHLFMTSWRYSCGSQNSKVHNEMIKVLHCVSFVFKTSNLGFAVFGPEEQLSRLVHLDEFIALPLVVAKFATNVMCACVFFGLFQFHDVNLN